ncbi:MAG: hypothetical protein MJ176_06305 [Treponema sp.]|nr:hypothetical protein [Treponema sp.]
MKKLSFVLFPLFLVITLVAMVVFRSVPSGKLWKGYSVLYVPVETPDDAVLSCFSQTGIENVTCLSGQYLPVLYKAHSVEVSMISFNPEATKYLNDRENYFYDKSQNYRLYYIPVSEKNELSQCVNLLRDNGITAGIDLSAPYPWIIPVLAVLFFLVLLFLAADKTAFGLSGFIYVLFNLCFPFLTSVSSSFIFMIFLFSISSLIFRRGLLDYISKRIILIFLGILSIVSCFTQSAMCGFMFILCTLTSVLALIFYFDSKKFIEGRQTGFRPVLIRSVYFVPKYNGSERVVFPISLLLTVICFTVCVFFMDSFSTQVSKLSLPAANVSSRDQNLTDLEDYARWKWEVQSFPYRNINLESDAKSYVKFPRYSEVNGKIVEGYDIASFNESYILNTNDEINELPFNALEKVLLSQSEDGKNITPGFTLSVSYQLSIFSIIMVVVQILSLAVYFVKIAFSRGGRR